MMSTKARKKNRTSFGATAPPFIDYLKDILRRYPDGGQILKELIQNADDSGATEVVFIHDNRSYGTENLWPKDLAKYQGPALYAYNDAQFTDEDWKGIQNVARSIKRDDPNKVGRFGLGFNSVYHITDVTSIFSAGHLGMMDPQEKLFGEHEGGFCWSLDEEDDREALTTKIDQFQPFRDIVSLVSGQEWSRVVQEDQNFNGTLFRFPLRSEASEISDNLYSYEKVVELFDSFIADAELSVLFLKNVSSVSLIHIDARGSVSTKLQVKSTTSQAVNLKSDTGATECFTQIKNIGLKESRQKKWLVTSCTMKEGNVDKLDSLAEKLKFVPRVDLAFPCDDDHIDCSKSRLCCFLPLPNNESNKTGLPVHVNAYFGLTDNRRHIKWLEEDQRNDEHAIWNEVLVKEVLPKTYLTIIRDAIQLVQDNILPVNSIYNLWPDISQVQHKEKWYMVALDFLGQLFSQEIALLSLAKDEREFITLSEAVLPCNGPTTSETLAAIRRILVSCNVNLVNLSDSVVKAIKAAYPDCSSLTHVSPALLRNTLRSSNVMDICDADRITLLEFVLSDEQYRDLHDLQLIPLSDGSFKSFTDREKDIVLIDSQEFPRTLLPFCQSLFLKDGLNSECVDHLRRLAGQNLFMVTNIDADQVLRYTQSHLPEDWKKTKNRLVTWDVKSGQQPPLNWLQEFWKFLNCHFTELSDFIGLPLIPVTTMSSSQPVKLAKIQRNPTLIFERSKKVIIPENITQLVNKVGGTVVKENNWLRHDDLDSYVLSPSPKHVLQVFVNLQSQQVLKELRSVPKRSLEELKEYISHLESLSKCEKELLLQLPLFQTMKGEYTSAQSKQAVLMISGLRIPTDVPMTDSVVKCATEADRRLLQLLKISLLDTAQAASLLIDSVETRACTKAETEKIMTWILDNGNILFYQNPNLKRRCTNLSFIDIKTKLKNASGLFDPRVHAFKVLFEEDYFPPTVYTKTTQMLASLIDLGLINKELDVSPEHLLHAATLVEKLTSHDPQEARKRAQVFLKILDANDLLENFTNDQLEKLKGLKWVPVTKQNDSMLSGFFCPEEMRHSMYEDIVGFVMPLEGTLSENICMKLGLKRPPPPEKVVANLTILIPKVEKMTNPDTNEDFKRKLRSIYGHMQKSVYAYTAVISEDTQWLWNHSRFVAPKELVLNYPHNLDLSSHVGKVPDEFLLYKSLFQEFGLREELTDEEITALLYTIKQTIESREVEFATASEVKVSIDILNWIWREKKVVSDDIPVPVIVQPGQYTLKPKSETVFCDLSKNGLKELESSQEEIHVVHEEILMTTAEWLDIQLLSTYILDPKSIGIEQCGQTEPITTRIKNILKEYDEESDIFKEIIQNAEDAGAHTCKFLLDFRVHKDDPESLIDPDMKLCQGPCIWAFNNEQFSQNDWDNIVRVGSASKETKVEKIGMFGLGFNTVYHITDIPSILSGSTLLILDPNITHLKKRIKHKSNPGIKLDLSQERLFHWFRGQFAPYEGVFNCSFSGQTTQNYPGTLIKLPFRTEEESLSSEISSKIYYNQDIMTLQKQFTKDSQSHLIFLKNVNTVLLQTARMIASTPLKHGDIEDIFRVSKRTLCSLDIPEEGCLSMQHHAEELLIQFNRKNLEVIDCRKVDIVEITCQKSGEEQVQCWLLYNCFGTKEALKMVTANNKNFAFSLPIGGIALPLQFNHEAETFVPSQTNPSGQAFCFLPLSISTGLPFNVNGTFAVTSNRKGLWESGVKHEWNKSILKDPLVTAFITALLALKEMSQNKKLESYSYHTFWPDREQVSETFRPLVDAFYSTIAQPCSALRLFSDGEHWFTLENALILHETIEEDQNICSLAIKVCQKYVKSSHVVALPRWIRNTFKQSGLEMVLQDKTWNWERFYKEAVFKNLVQMDPEWRDTLMLQALHLNMKEIDSLMVSYPCIPSTNGQLQYIQNLVNPKGKAACLFEHEEGRLLGGTINDFCSPENVFRLQGLGMASDELPLEEITNKAEAISKVWSNNKTKAYNQIQCLLELLKLHLHNDASSVRVTLSAAHFLPTFSPGDAKMEREVTLQRPADVFIDRCSLLVSMTQPVVDLSKLKIHSSDPVLQMLGVKECPSPETVVEQLKEATKHCQSLDKSVLHKIANECYKFLDHCLCDSDNDTQNIILQSLTSFPFILVGDKFVNVSCVAETAQFEARPYLHVLPHHFTNFRTLWEKVGVTKKFTANQCQEALNNIHLKHESKPLSESDLSVCLTILNKGIYEAGQKMNNCLVPNENGVLQPAQTLFYNDSPWIPVEKNATFCHQNISRVMALHLGIKTTRHHTLNNYAVENLSPFAFQFEQHEDLTVRIKNIISAYPSKKDILKELLQNADDAEATEIHFVWDKRQHNSEKTFGEKWNDLQGPALCVFNNKVFSDADLKGIQQLGEGGKHNSPGKTGKYGLGFNSVFHLTDCPSILTGDKLLCISDPNRKYVESTSDVSPAGMGYELDDNFKEMYMDVYNTFLPDDFTLKEGTMFRLPLRTNAMADNSKISQQNVTEHDMKDLCSALSEDPEGLILFLKHIAKIQIHEIDQSGTLQPIFSVEKCVQETFVNERDTFVRLKENAFLLDKPVEPQKVIYEMVISTLQKTTTSWIIAEQFSSFENTHDSVQIPNDKLAHAAIAALVNQKGSQREPKNVTLLSGAFGAQEQNNKGFNGVAFCSLPLPGHTGLPVHINANFEVDSSRKNLWKEDGESQKMNWNENLKQTIIAPLYADLLDYLRCRLADKQDYQTKVEKVLKESYLRFFPTATKHVHPYWHEMVHEVYKSIQEKCLAVIPVYKCSAEITVDKNMKTYFFDWCNTSETDPIKIPHLLHVIKQEVRNILEDVGMRLVPACMQQVWSSFKSAGIELSYVSPLTVQTFLRAKPLNHQSQTEKQLPLPISETLIKDENCCSELLRFCLKDLQPLKENDTDAEVGVIHGLPLLLTKDKVLRVFDINSPKMASRYEQLFIGYENMLVDYSTNWEHISILESYGFVKMLTIHNAVEYLKPLMERFLHRCDIDTNRHYIPSKEMQEWLKHLWKFIISQLSRGSDGLTLAVVRQLYSECSILPVICPQNEKNYLRMMRDMPSVIQFSNDRDLSKTLFKLGFMKLNNLFFSEMDRMLHSHLHSELMNVTDSSCVLDQLCNTDTSEFLKLSSKELNELQNFLNCGVVKAENAQDYQRKFKSLPLFETINSERVTIGGLQKVFVINMFELIRFPALWTLPDVTTIFLKNSPENQQLTDTLKLPKLSDLDFFVQFILPVAHKLTERQTLDCLKLMLSIQHNYNYSQYRDCINSTFKNIKVIRSSLGKLEIPSYFYNFEIELFRVMLPTERCVPDAFWNELSEKDRQRKSQSKELLAELGMRIKVSANDVITFAHQVEREVTGKNETLKKKSEVVFKAALKFVNDSENKKTNLLESIADIKFLFPVKIKTELCNYHQSFTTEDSAVPIRGALIESNREHQELIWSSMPIIHVPVNKSEKLLEKLCKAGAFENPPPEKVTENMRNICLSPCRSEQIIQTRTRVFHHLYAFLQTTSFNSHPLIEQPIILVENNNKLVKAEYVLICLRHDDDFRPYLYQMPPELALYRNFFTKIGVKMEPTTTQFCNVLAEIHNETIIKPGLQPNQRKTVRRVVQQLFNLLKQANGNQTLDAVKTLYLPGKLLNGKLQDSSKLYYNNTVYHARLEQALPENYVLLDKLSKYHLGRDIYEHHKLLKLLPQKLQPQMLLEITEEKVVETQMELCERNCDFSGFFREHLSSTAFRHGLICLIRAQSGGTVKHEEAMEMCNTTFGRIQIICCQSLQTELWLEKEKLPNTAAETGVYVKQEQQGCVFYLKHHDASTHKVTFKVCSTLANEINSLLGNKLSNCHLTVLQELLLCDSLEEVKDLLTEHQIHDSAEDERLLFDLPSPGTEIPEEWHDALDMNILNNFEKGEYVGYYSNGKYIYAVIVEELPGHSGQLRRRYKIDVGEEEPIEVSFLDLYQFKCGTPTPSAGWELQLVEGAFHSSSHSGHSSQQSTRSTPTSLEEAKKEIDKCLNDIWTLPKEERNKAIKRLYLRWHPDKNPDCPFIATEAFKYLKNRIDELKNGKRQSAGFHSSSSYSNFQDFFHQWNEEARRHRTSRERFRTGGRSYNFWSFNENIPRPNKEEAKRWCRQAQCDLKAAHKDTGGDSTEWCLFKVHQAVEKSLIAASYRNNGKQPNCSSISAMASKVSSYSPQLRGLSQLVRDLIALDVDAKKTQYPTYHSFPNIPNGQFRSANETRALHKASEILALIKEYVDN